MKPPCPFVFDRRLFPQTDYFFQSGFKHWRGSSFPYDGDDDSEIRKFHDFSRASMAESRRERATEMAVFALVVLASAWPVIYMVVTVVQLLSKGAPLNQ